MIERLSSSFYAEYGGVEHQRIMKEGRIPTTLLHDGVFDTGSNCEDRVEKFFNLKIANSEESEICIGHIKCGCIRLWEESPQERYGRVLIYFIILTSNT